MSSDLKINTKTKIGNFVDVQRSLQELQKNFNILVEKVASPAEKEIGESEGITGDIQISRNKDDSYTFEVRTEDGWKTPVMGDSLIKFKGKPKTFSKSQDKSIDEISADDTTTGNSKANKTIYDEKNSKFVLPRPDYDSGWFDVRNDRQYVTGATDGVAPDSCYIYADYPSQIVGIPALGFELQDYPSLVQVLFSSYKTTSFEQSFDGKTGTSGTDALIAITADGAGQYYHSAKGMGCRIFMTNKEHICVSTGEDHLYYWHANHAGGGSITTATSNWTDVYDAGGGTDDQCSIRLKLWK